MSAKHTPGRLKVGRISHSSQSAEIDAESHTAWMGMYPWEGLAECRGCNEHKTRGSEVMEANARRLVACWNRLERFSTEDIENPAVDLTGHGELLAKNIWLKSVNDELLDALKLAHGALHHAAADVQAYVNAAETVRAAIAKVERKA